MKNGRRQSLDGAAYPILVTPARETWNQKAPVISAWKMLAKRLNKNAKPVVAL